MRIQSALFISLTTSPRPQWQGLPWGPNHSDVWVSLDPVAGDLSQLTAAGGLTLPSRTRCGPPYPHSPPEKTSPLTPIELQVYNLASGGERRCGSGAETWCDWGGGGALEQRQQIKTGNSEAPSSSQGDGPHCPLRDPSMPVPPTDRFR